MIPVTWDMALALQPGSPEAERANRIRLTPAADRTPRRSYNVAGETGCAEFPVTVTGTEDTWQLATLGSSAVLRSGSRVLRPKAAWLHAGEDGYWQTACSAEFIPEKVSVEFSAVLAVSEEEPQSKRSDPASNCDRARSRHLQCGQNGAGCEAAVPRGSSPSCARGADQHGHPRMGRRIQRRRGHLIFRALMGAPGRTPRL